MEDAEIVSLYWARDQRAIDETGTKYGCYLTKTAMNVQGDPEDAGECVNDTYLAAWNAMPPNKPELLRIFLGKITRRISLTRLRARLVQKRGGGEAAGAIGELAEILPFGDDTEKTVEMMELARSLDIFLESFRGRERAIFLRRYFHFEPAASRIADAAGISVGAVKSSLHRTRDKLRDFLEKEEWI